MLKKRGRKHAYDKTGRDKIIKDFLSGTSVNKLAEKYDIHRTTVYDYIEEYKNNKRLNRF
jgi:DNA invertase Pin-like site-specific DNA recombinase